MPCDLACRTKIILNGANVYNILEATCDRVKALPEGKLDHQTGEKMIEILNRMEDDACVVQKLLLDGVGYSGEVGKMLS